MDFETKKKGNRGKKDKVPENYVVNPTRYDLFVIDKARPAEGLFSDSMFKEEGGLERYDHFSEDNVIDYKYANPSNSTSRLRSFLAEKPKNFCDRIKIETLKNKLQRTQIDLMVKLQV